MVQQDVLQVLARCRHPFDLRPERLDPVGQDLVPPVAVLRAGLVSAEFSIVSGGLACIAGAALLTVLLPGFRRYRRPALASQPAPASQPAGPEMPRRGPDVAGESTVPPGPCPEGTG